MNFQLEANYAPAGDQINAISELTKGLQDNLKYQTLLGATGTGKTFTMANIIANTNRPALILAHNKTLAAQLYSEFKSFFPNNAVEYFVSYYDYYQPEAYVPASDTFIDKDASINEHIEQMRLSATKSLLERKDVIVIATVSSIYGLGSPESYLKMVLSLQIGDKISQKDILRKLNAMQYERGDVDFYRATFRVRGDIIDIFPAESEFDAIRVELFDDEVESIAVINPITGRSLQKLKRFAFYPKSNYVTPREVVNRAIEEIKTELAARLIYFLQEHRLVEHQRLEERTKYDVEMLVELGYCSGIENYSRYLSGKKEGEPPPTLYDYIPQDTLIFIDESHTTVPQIGAMYKGDRSRKENLVNYGFRLPSALDNRPLKFEEWEEKTGQMIFVSATPSKYEAEHQQKLVEQVVRPTGLLDPIVEVKPSSTQVDDVLEQIKLIVKKDERILITTLTKRMAEDLTDYLTDCGIKVRYLHSDIDTVERVEIIRDLRLGTFDVLVGINLLREGLDMPEVSLVAILDADKEGFLRSERSLIQTIGRAARNENGRAILYADKITFSMQKAIDETNRRRKKQEQYNKEHGITPKTIKKAINDILDIDPNPNHKTKRKKQNKDDVLEIAILDFNEIQKLIKSYEKEMKRAAQDLDFEEAASLRDKISQLKMRMLQ